MQATRIRPRIKEATQPNIQVRGIKKNFKSNITKRNVDACLYKIKRHSLLKKGNICKEQ